MMCVMFAWQSREAVKGKTVFCVFNNSTLRSNLKLQVFPLMLFLLLFTYSHQFCVQLDSFSLESLFLPLILSP